MNQPTPIDKGVFMAEMVQLGYHPIRELPDGKVAAVHSMLYTTGLFVGLDSTGFERRYCYERRKDAVDALAVWDGKGDPPGPWIKEKPSDRLGPGATK